MTRSGIRNMKNEKKNESSDLCNLAHAFGTDVAIFIPNTLDTPLRIHLFFR